MVKKILIMLCMILLVGTISAMNWDNRLTNYDDKTKTVTIENAFGFGDTISKIKLDTPIINYVIKGKDRLVAEFTIESFDDYNDVFNDMEFYNVKKGMSKFNRGFDYKYKSYYDVTINDYETTCKEKQVTNGTEKYDCYEKKIGEHTEKKVRWNNFNDKAELPKGNITIGVFTDVLPDEEVEWIPTLFGVEIDEWATWKDSWNTELIYYYNCSSVTEPVTGTDFDEGVFNTTNGFPLNDESSCHGELNMTDGTPFDFAYTNITFSGWVWLPADTGYLFGHVSAASGWNLLWQANTLKGSGLSLTNLQPVTNPIENEVWHYFTVTINDSHCCFWVNGSMEDCDAANVSRSSPGVPFVWGNDVGHSELIEGAIFDEWGWWNRTLTPTEISDLYNDKVGVSRDSVEGIVLNFPPNNYTTLTMNNTFNCSAGSTVGVQNITLIIDGVRNYTKTIGGGSNGELFIQANMSAGSYLWNCTARDISNDEITQGVAERTTKVGFNETAETYNSTSDELFLETLKLNVTYNTSYVSDVSVTLFYNHVSYLTTKTGTGTTATFSTDIVTPKTNKIVNIPFHWRIGLTSPAETKYYNTTNRTMVVSNVRIDDCGNYSTLLFNFTLNDEENTNEISSALNTTINLDLILYSIGTTNSLNFSQTYLNRTNNISVCINASSLSYTADLVVHYKADTYVEEYYNLDSYSFIDSGISKNISLYDLLTADSTSFIVSYTDENNIEVEDAIISLHRYYTGEGVWREVEAGRTNDDGETILHLVQEDVIYKFNVTLNGVHLFTSKEHRVYCTTGTTCTIDLENVEEVPDFPDDWDRLPEGSWRLTSNRTSRTISLNFELTSAQLMNLTVYEYSNNESVMSTIIGQNTTTASSGSLTTFVPLSYGNKTFYAVAYKNDIFLGSSWADLKENPEDYFGTLGYIMTGLMVLTLGLMAISTGAGIIIFAVLGLIFAEAARMITMSYTTIIYLIAASIISIIKIRQRSK